MGKDKIRRFEENLTFECLFQPLFEEIFDADYCMKGNWRSKFFKNDNPVILELGCGRGEYTVGLAKMFPDKNFIGIDVKGARLWRGAKTITEENIPNGAFIRTRIEFISSLFAEGEIDEIWITFPDPQLKKNRVKKRLTSPLFLKRYSQFLKSDGVVNLKTDSLHLHQYTRAVAEKNGLKELLFSTDIYNSTEPIPNEVVALKTTYESRYLTEGKPITFLKFSLSGCDQFTEPEFEPDELL